MGPQYEIDIYYDYCNANFFTFSQMNNILCNILCKYFCYNVQVISAQQFREDTVCRVSDLKTSRMRWVGQRKQLKFAGSIYQAE